MTPEERAAKLARAICTCTCYAPGAALDIAAAIREAVKAERAACLTIAENHRNGSVRSNRARGHNEACEDIAAAIRARTP